MWWASLFTAPFGLTEPLFVPEYWNPPSLFDLAQRTGFDIESLIFCFAIGGIGAVLYNVFTGKTTAMVSHDERCSPRHRYHRFALVSPFLAFPLLYFLPWNPIYPGIVAMAVGTIATMLCRPDLATKSWGGGLLFLLYYVVFLTGLEWSAPGYIDRIWNLEALSGVTPCACRWRNCCLPSPSACTGPVSMSISPGHGPRIQHPLRHHNRD